MLGKFGLNQARFDDAGPSLLQAGSRAVLKELDRDSLLLAAKNAEARQRAFRESLERWLK